MGRTLPTYTRMILGRIVELKPFYLALCRSDQLILDKFFEAILQYRSAMSNADSLLSIEIFSFVILLEERKRMDRLYSELVAELEELEKRVNLLSPPT